MRTRLMVKMSWGWKSGRPWLSEPSGTFQHKTADQQHTACVRSSVLARGKKEIMRAYSLRMWCQTPQHGNSSTLGQAWSIVLDTKMECTTCSWAKQLKIDSRVHFIHANATISMKSVLADYPGYIKLICIQFPDPHFKRRHRKRHSVQPQTCTDLAAVLSPGGRTPSSQFLTWSALDHYESTCHCNPQQTVLTTKWLSTGPFSPIVRCGGGCTVVHSAFCHGC
jgi:hypothetical protein